MRLDTSGRISTSEVISLLDYFCLEIVYIYSEYILFLLLSMHVSNKEKFLTVSVSRKEWYTQLCMLENSAPTPKKWILLQGERNWSTQWLHNKWKDQTVCHKVTISMMIIIVQQQNLNIYKIPTTINQVTLHVNSHNPHNIWD